MWDYYPVSVRQERARREVIRERDRRVKRSAGESVAISGLGSQGWISQPPDEVTETLVREGYKYEKLNKNIEDFGPTGIVIGAAIIAAGAGVVSTAISAAASYIAKVKEGKVVITGKSGRIVELPAGASKKDIDFFIQKAKELDVESIDIIDRPVPPGFGRDAIDDVLLYSLATSQVEAVLGMSIEEAKAILGPAIGELTVAEAEAKLRMSIEEAEASE